MQIVSGMRNLYLHENGTYYVRVQVRHQIIQRSLWTHDYDAALEIYRHLLKEFATGRVLARKRGGQIDNKTARHRIEPALSAWIKKSADDDNSKTSLYIKRGIRDMLLSINIRYLDNINQGTIDKFFEMMVGKKPNTLSTYKSRLKGFLNFCEREKLISLDQRKSFKFPTIKKDKRSAKVIIKDYEYAKLLEFFKDDAVNAMLIKTLWNCGLRPESEGLNVRRSDIRVADRVLHVDQSKTDRPKDIVLSPEFIREIMEYCDNSGIKSDDYLFRGRQKGGRTDSYLSNNFDAICAKIGLRPELILYSFRHAFANRLMKMTGNLKFVSEQLGHTNTRTTEDYLHEIVSDNVEIFDKAMKNSQTG